MDRNLALRLGFAAVAIPLALLVVWLGGWPLVALIAILGALGARELYGLLRRDGVVALELPGMIGAALFAVAVYLVLRDPAGWVAAAWPYLGAAWLITVMGLALFRRAPTERPLEAVSATLFGACYAGALPAFLIDLRHGAFGTRSWAGAWLVFFPLVVTWVCDTAAMFGGRAIGGPKLAPTVSPGKTRAGSIAGVLGGVAVAPIFYLLIFPKVGVEVSLGSLLLIAGVLSVIGQIGDLAESLFKREAGVKDSSHLIPGHGGVLDRFDSLYFVIPVAAAMYRALGVH